MSKKLLINIILTLICLIPSWLDGQSLTVMTYNIRFDYAPDGINSWPNRKENVAEVIRKYRADIIGLQEVLKNQLDDLQKLLPDSFSWVGVGREDGLEKGEYNPIFFNAKRFVLLKSETFWLSSTPKIPSKSWKESDERICTWALFLDIKTRDTVWMYNTHLDAGSRKARKLSARLIKDTITAMTGNRSLVFLSADLNSNTCGKPYRIFTRSGRKIFDSRTITTNTQGPKQTFKGFKVGKKRGRRIDYIFLGQEKSSLKVTDYTTATDNRNGFYPSDHLPVIIKISY